MPHLFPDFTGLKTENSALRIQAHTCSNSLYGRQVLL
jgi:hypothetical protein